MKISPSIHSHSFIDAQRQNRRRRYSLSSPQLFESRADTSLHHSDTLSTKIHSISSNSNLLFPSNETDAEKYDILSKLNTGAYGSSYLIRDSNDGQIYLLKRIDDSLPDRFRQRLWEERRLLGCLKSNYILPLISAYTDTQHHCFSMKFEYINGITLLQLLRRFRWFEESVVAFYSAQIVLAFEYFHELNLIYRNLKLETILLTDHGYIKLSDFAFTRLLPSHTSSTHSIVGVPDLMPPEMLLGQSYSFSVDWWQLGIAMFEMLTSYSPFYASSMMQTHENVLCNHRAKFPLRLSSSVKSTCRLLLQPNVKKRLGCSIIGDRDPKHRAEEIIRICDVTGNKKLTKEEFIAGCKNDPVIRRLLVPNA
ncbi:unnamed protein product [Adineta ricciae]|uniref:Uncharacterized protein n=2 Tax=Adineta ricciae TaxID=249248 RepID=A0A814KCL6_ADIRI|nr:unnamed protein product [Adineta ricciae]